jgi:hypothetical protein
MNTVPYRRSVGGWGNAEEVGIVEERNEWGNENGKGGKNLPR